MFLDLNPLRSAKWDLCLSQKSTTMPLKITTLKLKQNNKKSRTPKKIRGYHGRKNLVLKCLAKIQSLLLTSQFCHLMNIISAITVQRIYKG